MKCGFKKKISKKVIGVFDIPPAFEDQFSENENSLILVTSYFELSKKIQDDLPNHKNISKGIKNFETKEEALDTYFEFFNEFRNRAPLRGNKGLIQKIIILKNIGNTITGLQIQQEEEKLFEEILTKFCGGKDFYNCTTKQQFLSLLS